jgi:hypothetical protein
VSEKVQGRCPQGCGDTLILRSGGYVTCTWEKCPDPGSVSDLLLDHSEHRHLVVIGEAGFVIEHPLRERNGGLFACPLHEYMVSLSGPPCRPGRYKAELVDGEWEFWGTP